VRGEFDGKVRGGVAHNDGQQQPGGDEHDTDELRVGRSRAGR
jgi:hypothetical protein